MLCAHLRGWFGCTMDIDADANKQAAEMSAPSTPPREKKPVAVATAESDFSGISLEAGGSADALALGGSPPPSDAVAALTAMVEEFKVEVLVQNAISGNLSKLTGRLGERIGRHGGPDGQDRGQRGRHVTGAARRDDGGRSCSSFVGCPARARQGERGHT